MKGRKWATVDAGMNIVGQRVCLALGKLGRRRTGLPCFRIRDQGAITQCPDASKTGYGQVLVYDNGSSWIMRCCKRLHERMGFDPCRPDQRLRPNLFLRSEPNHSLLRLDKACIQLESDTTRHLAFKSILRQGSAQLRQNVIA